MQSVAETASGVPSMTATQLYGKKKAFSSKRKTTICYYYKLGLSCPFDDKCGFAHVESDVSESGTATTATSGLTASQLSSRHTFTRPVSPEVDSCSGCGAQVELGVSTYPMRSDSAAENSPGVSRPPPPPPPPSYAEVCGNADGWCTAEDFVPSNPPPMYPSRYRYNPYSYSVYLYEI